MIHHVRSSYPDFNKNRFLDTLRLEDWPELTLKERMRHVTVSLYETLPKQYVEALTILRDTAPHFKGLSGILFPDYVEQYGLAHWEESSKGIGILYAIFDLRICCKAFFAVRSRKDDCTIACMV